MFQFIYHGANYLVDIMRRNLRRVAGGNAGRAVDEEVRKFRREHRRLVFLVVKIGNEPDRFFIDVAQEILAVF